MESILEEAQRITHNDRNGDYGHPYDDHERVARMWEPILGLPIGSLDPAKIGLCMIAVKISRQIYKPKRDNLVDIAGYAWVTGQVEERQQEIKE